MWTKVQAKDIKNQAFLTTGTAPDYEITIPREWSYTEMDRMEILVNFHEAGSGNITLNINWLWAKDTGLTAVDADSYYNFIYDESKGAFEEGNIWWGNFMKKADYDSNDDWVVDDSEWLDGNDWAYYKDRANHTGTQTASTISDFDTEVSNNTDVAANTNDRHSHSNMSDLDNVSWTNTWDQNATWVDVNTTNFDNNLSSSDDTVQKALETLDELTTGWSTGSDTSLDTSNFDNNLSSADDNVQKALETLDDVAIWDWDMKKATYDNDDNVSEQLLGKTATQTVTNKRITPRVWTVASWATITPTWDTSDIYTVTALAEDTTINAPSWTPTNWQKLILRIKDDGADRALTWDAIYNTIWVNLPLSTTTNKHIYIWCVYNVSNSKWDVVAVWEE